MKNAKAWRDGGLAVRLIRRFVPMKSQTVTNFVCEDHTSQIDVILTREPDSNLFVFHKGTDKNLHVEWNRAGEVVKEDLDIQ